MLSSTSSPSAISIHALCEEGDIPLYAHIDCICNFYPRPLRGGRLEYCFAISISFKISIHALCEEGDPQYLQTSSATFVFLSTPSARRATACSTLAWTRNRNFYPRPLRGGRLLRHCAPPPPQPISIHALCEEGDVLDLLKPTEVGGFLSTPSARRATGGLSLLAGG